MCNEVEMQRSWTLQKQQVCLYIIGEEMSKHRGLFECAAGLSECISCSVPLLSYLCLSTDNTCALILVISVKLSLRKIYLGEGR